MCKLVGVITFLKQSVLERQVLWPTLAFSAKLLAAFTVLLLRWSTRPY